MARLASVAAVRIVTASWTFRFLHETPHLVHLTLESFGVVVGGFMYFMSVALSCRLRPTRTSQHCLVHRFTRKTL